MPPEAFQEFENRMSIIAGKEKVKAETAKRILDRIYFYPPAQHAYQCSICGRACDMACYIHLEEEGLLKKIFSHSFRKRKEWRFGLSDFEES